MSQLFDRIKVGSTARSTFDLSHHQVFSSDFGYLIPICVREMVPNDDFVVKPSLFVRLAPMTNPVYGRIQCRIHHFFIPNRILFPQWDAWITGDASNNTIPPYLLQDFLIDILTEDRQFVAQGSLPRGTYGKLWSNLGLNPTLIGGDRLTDQRYSALPLLAYYRVWLDWFMDSSINDHPTMVRAFNEAIKNGGNVGIPANVEFFKIKSCCYKKDYFTSARQSPQEGSASKVAVDVASPALNSGLTPGSSASNIRLNSDGTVFSNASSALTPNTVIGQFTVEAERRAIALQRYLERNNFVGTKLINRLLAHFGISPKAERIDMSEFIGGSSFPIQIADVTQTNSVDLTKEGLGAYAGKGVGAGSDSVSYHASEHGIFLSLMSILPDTGYVQGVPKMFTRGVYGDHLDYFTPEFENLGFQEILNKEVYVPSPGDVASYQTYDGDGIFGYQPRYSDYKFQNDILGSDFTPNALQDIFGFEMDSFHLMRKLRFTDAAPLALNNNFVELNNSNNDFDRIFQVTNKEYDHFFFNADVDVKATRPMTGFGEPSLDFNNSGDGRSMNLPYGGTRL